METVKFGISLKISSVREEWDKLKPLIEKSGKAPVLLDFSELEILDGAGIQFLVFLLNQKGAQKDSITIEGLSESVRKKLLDNGYQFKE